MKNETLIRTKRLRICALTEKDLSEKSKEERFSPFAGYFEDALSRVQNAPDAFFWNTLWAITDEKTGEELGCLRCCGAPAEGEVEIELALFGHENVERRAADALKAFCRRLFRKDPLLQYISVWLQRVPEAIRILDAAGFERVFERDGLVRCHKERPRVTFLAIFMTIFTALGIVAGTIFHNYPVCIAIGIAAGIAPGAIADGLAKKVREKRRKKKTA